MPSAPIGSGVFLHYEDSGAPPGVDRYTTIVLVHGLAFNGGKQALLACSWSLTGVHHRCVRAYAVVRTTEHGPHHYRKYARLRWVYSIQRGRTG